MEKATTKPGRTKTEAVLSAHYLGSFQYRFSAALVHNACSNSRCSTLFDLGCGRTFKFLPLWTHPTPLGKDICSALTKGVSAAMSTPSAIDLYAIVKCQAYVRGYLQRQTYKWISTPPIPDK